MFNTVMSTPSPGELRSCVDLIRLVDGTVTSFGTVPRVDELVGHYRAKFESMDGAEKERMKQLCPMSTHRIWMRYCAELSVELLPEMHLMMGTRRFEIEYVHNVNEMNRWLLLYGYENKVSE